LSRAYDPSIDSVQLPVQDPSLGTVVVGPIDPELSYELRQRVLRPHQRVEEMSSLDPSGGSGLVVGAVVESSATVVATATVLPEAAPPELEAALPPGRRWRLRGMATAPEVRGRGLGWAALELVIAHVGAHGGGVLWCSARVPAAGFYEKAGFARFGQEWEADRIGPHVLMWRAVEPSRQGARST